MSGQTRGVGRRAPVGGPTMTAALRRILVDGEEIEVDSSLTLLQACEAAGHEMPRFCYHERLSIAGNCRMCLVEVVGGLKPVASCAMQVRDLRPGPDQTPPALCTSSDTVRRARQGVMEFLLINHPLDCPICDQGGECDLQDQAIAYGADFSRYREPKRAPEPIDLGPLVKTEMTRCIHCTRCVRFLTEIAGIPELGLVGRGEDAAIVPYLGRSLSSEMQGNIIDLCPVGALTSRPYAFTARSWELHKVETIDVMDALGANIRVDLRGREVMRILPRNHDALNEEWISDKTRFVWDGLGRQRLDRPYLRGGEGRLQACSWDRALETAGARLAGAKPESVAALAGDLVSVEAMWALRGLLDGLGVASRDCRQHAPCLPPENPSAWRFNSQVAGIDQADAILLVGTDPRRECPVLNTRIRKAWLGGAAVASIGPELEALYACEGLGAGPETLARVAELPFGARLAAAERPLVVVGEGALARSDGAAVLAAAMQLAETVGAVREDWCGFSVLHSSAAVTGGLETGFVPAEGGRDTSGILAAAREGALETVFLLGADEIEMDALRDCFVIYLGSHGDAGAGRADLVLPGAAWTEQSGLFVNLEGRPQVAARASFPPGEAREDWRILRALSVHLGAPLPYDDLTALRAHLFESHPRLAETGVVPPVAWRAESGGEMDPRPFGRAVGDFYLTNPIARASAVMADLSRRRGNPGGSRAAA